jgi:hypothetical protein
LDLDPRAVKIMTMSGAKTNAQQKQIPWITGVWSLLLLGALTAVWFGLNRQREIPVEPFPLGWREFFQDYIRSALPLAETFDFPLRPPTGEGSRCVVPFREKDSLGEWWEPVGVRGVAEPVHSVADGWVTLAEDFGRPWGNVAIIAHRLPDGGYPDSVEVLYSNLASLAVQRGHFVQRGQLIGTLDQEGRARNRLYLEIREEIGMGLGPTDGPDELGWANPSKFLKQRHVPPPPEGTADSGELSL